MPGPRPLKMAEAASAHRAPQPRNQALGEIRGFRGQPHGSPPPCPSLPSDAWHRQRRPSAAPLPAAAETRGSRARPWAQVPASPAPRASLSRASVPRLHRWTGLGTLRAHRGKARRRGRGFLLRGQEKGARPGGAGMNGFRLLRTGTKSSRMGERQTKKDAITYGCP